MSGPVTCRALWRQYQAWSPILAGTGSGTGCCTGTNSGSVLGADRPRPGRVSDPPLYLHRGPQPRRPRLGDDRPLDAGCSSGSSEPVLLDPGDVRVQVDRVHLLDEIGDGLVVVHAHDLVEHWIQPQEAVFAQELLTVHTVHSRTL